MSSVAANIAVVVLLFMFMPLPTVLFVISEEIIAGFQPQERDALMQIRDSMNSSVNLHGNWTGPPCHKNISKWYGVVCSDWHIVELVLEGIQLSGSLPPTFLQNITFLTKVSFKNNAIYGELPDLTNLVSLESVLFSCNRFTGLIPDQYIGLPKLREFELQQNYVSGEIPAFGQQTLQVFNVSYNQLQGQIPATDVLQRFPNSSYAHNPDLCGFPLDPCQVPTPPPPSPTSSPSPSPPQDKTKKLETWSIALIAAAAALIPFVVMFVVLCYNRKVRGKEDGKEQQQGTSKKTGHSLSTEDPERTVELEFFDRSIPVFDLDDLLRSSAEVLGRGKLGTTYKATLESGSVISVKRVKGMNNLSKKEFIQQMQLLGKMRHQNLVQVISFYYSREEKLVVYEFLPDGSLFEFLHENRGEGRVPLNWEARFSIVKDIAKGLSFLHQSLPSHKVPHANLKSSNVLIHKEGETYHSKLTNYGFLPLLPSTKSSQMLAIGRSPEFCQGKKLTHKADVYCFGILLLEVITGKIPGEVSAIPPNDEERADDLSEWVTTVVNNDWSTDILDVEILAARDGHEEMLKLTELALECTDVAPAKRPKTNEVLRRIQEIEQRRSGNI